jgi:hypothetical protein
MFCWPRIIVYQYIETNVMQFSFNLLRIKGLYMFRALLARPQRAHTSDIWYIACGCQLAVSTGCVSETATLPQPTDIIHSVIPNAVFGAPPEGEQIMLEACRGPWFSINWMKSASRWFIILINIGKLSRRGLLRLLSETVRCACTVVPWFYMLIKWNHFWLHRKKGR